MNSKTDIIEHIPRLRRYARALLGDPVNQLVERVPLGGPLRRGAHTAALAPPWRRLDGSDGSQGSRPGPLLDERLVGDERLRSRARGRNCSVGSLEVVTTVGRRAGL